MSLILLIKESLGYGEEGAVSESSHSENEWLPRENGKVTHQLAWVGDKQQSLLVAVNHSLVDVEQTRDDKCHAHIL